MVEILGRMVGSDYPCYFVAELGSNHNGDYERAEQLIAAAYGAGFDAVKIQLFRADLLYRENYPEHRDRVRPYEVSVEWLADLRKASHCYGLAFVGTPLDIEAVALLVEAGVDAIKVASGDITWEAMLRAIGDTRLSVMLSTGAAKAEEVRDAIRWIGSGNLVVMRCVSSYPAPLQELNLRSIRTLCDWSARGSGSAMTLPFLVGWSDHSVDPDVVLSAYLLGASVVEMHLDLGDGLGVETGHSFSPGEAARVITRVHAIRKCLGDGQIKPAPCEVSERFWARRGADGLRPHAEGPRNHDLV